MAVGNIVRTYGLPHRFVPYKNIAYAGNAYRGESNVQWLFVVHAMGGVAGFVDPGLWQSFFPKFLGGGKKWIYWIELAILVVCAIWLPLKLFAWRPEFKAFALQMASFLLRAGLAYLLFVSGLLAIERLTSGGNPDLSQARRVASP